MAMNARAQGQDDPRACGVEPTPVADGPRLFAIVSWGSAGTRWLATTLNTHPDVHCLHGGNHARNKLREGPRFDGLPYFETLASEAPTGVKAVGDVHGVRRDYLPELCDGLGARFAFGFLVREPLARLRSQIALFIHASYKGWGPMDHVKRVAERVGRDPASLSVEERHFMHGVNMLNAIIEEEKMGPVYRLEDLSTDPDVLIACAMTATQGAVDFSRAWAEAAIGGGALNERSKQVGVHGFSDAENALIAKIVRPEAWEAYERLGYATPDFVG